jgi:hypothetical protein
MFVKFVLFGHLRETKYLSNSHMIFNKPLLDKVRPTSGFWLKKGAFNRAKIVEK